MGYTHIKILFVACLKFKFNLALCILPANPRLKAKKFANIFHQKEIEVGPTAHFQ